MRVPKKQSLIKKAWERPKWWCAAKKVSSYTVRREAVLEVCGKKYLSYKGVGAAVLEVSDEKLLHILSAERAFCGYPRKISHIKAWERLKKGVFAKKEISMQNMEDTEFVQIAQNRFSGKAA